MEPWSPIPHKIRDLGLSANAIAVFTIMATCQNKGLCFPSIRYLRAKTKLGTNSVLDAIAELVAVNMVVKVQKKGKPNKYQLLSDCYYRSNTTVTDAVTPIPATVTTVVTPDKPTVTDAVTPPLLQQEHTVTTVVTELQSLTKENIAEFLSVGSGLWSREKPSCKSLHACSRSKRRPCAFLESQGP